MSKNRFLMRKEYFGGLIYDRKTRRETLLDPWQRELLKSLLGGEFSTAELTAKETAFLEEMREKGIVTGNRLDLDSVEVAMIKDRVISAPMRLYYHITFGCNLACEHCMFGNKKGGKDELSTAEAMEVVRQLEDLGCPELRITGGEPTIRPDLFEVVQDAAGRGINVVVNTNGVFGDDIRESLLQSGVDGLVISIDGDRETHDRIRREGSFDITMDTIRYIAEHNRNAARKVIICLNPTIGRENVHHTEFLVRKALELGGAELGVEINFMPLRPFGKAKDLLPKMLDARGWLEFTREITRLRELPEVRENGLRLFSQNMDMFGRYDDCSRRPVPFDRSSCAAATFRMGLGPNGGGNICGFIGAEEEFRTPTTREATLLDIWHSGPFEKFRHVVKEPCEPCRFYRKECVGVCKAMSYALTGEFGKQDHYCFAELLPKA